MNTSTTAGESGHEFTTESGISLQYSVHGAGEPVLLLAGWPQTTYAWRKVMPLLIAEHRKVVLLDLRGQGQSGKPEIGYDLDSLADDVHQFIRHLNLGGDRGTDVVSHDVGSWVAYALASAHPSDVRRLVLSEMTLQTSRATRPIPDESANVASWHFGFNRLEGLPEALVTGRERLFLDWLFDNKSTRPEAIDETARAHYTRAFEAPGAARAGFEYYRALLSEHGLTRMDERVDQPLTMPVLAIGASGGVQGRLAAGLKDAAPLLDSEVIEGGHYLPEESPIEFASAVLDWWRRLDHKD